MKKILLILIVIVLMMTMLCGCVEGNMEEPRSGTEYQIWLNSGSCFVYSFKDEETGVWYVSTVHGITPRLNADGSLYVDEINTK